MDALERIKKQVTDNPIIIYMKGTPDFPQCGFSARTVQALNACDVEYAYVNIYEDEEIYRALPKFAKPSTFPRTTRCKIAFTPLPMERPMSGSCTSISPNW